LKSWSAVIDPSINGINGLSDLLVQPPELSRFDLCSIWAFTLCAYVKIFERLSIRNFCRRYREAIASLRCDAVN
jgi:hypothetical protein